MMKQLLRRARYSLGYRMGVLAGSDPLIPPRSLHDVGGSEYRAVGDEFLRHFVQLAGLQPHEQVLDVGAGTGRLARPLTPYLTSGSYDGLEIVAPSVRWCQRVYAPRFPNFRFHWADVYNKAYNARGSQQPAAYRFPFDDARFDFIFLTSVFTHMLPADLAQYLSEIARVLKPSGRCLITWFVLNPESEQLLDQGRSTIDFRFRLGECRLKQADIPEAAIAYPERSIRDLYRQNGLTIHEPIRYGSWCGRSQWLSYQDIVLATKE